MGAPRRAAGWFAAAALSFLSLAAAAEPLRISVIGGGMIGQRVVDEALSRGHDVTLIVRSPDRVDDPPAALSLRRGDVTDSEGLVALFRGQDVVVSAVGVARKEDPDYSLYRRAAESLVAALRQLGDAAPRLIVVGGFGSLEHPEGGLMLKRVPTARLPEHLGQKAALDHYRGATGVRWTYVSPPGRIAPGERTGRYRVGDDVMLMEDGGYGSISMEDYAVALIDEAEQARHVGRRFTVAH